MASIYNICKTLKSVPEILVFSVKWFTYNRECPAYMLLLYCEWPPLFKSAVEVSLYRKPLYVALWMLPVSYVSIFSNVCRFSRFSCSMLSKIFIVCLLLQLGNHLTQYTDVDTGILLTLVSAIQQDSIYSVWIPSSKRMNSVKILQVFCRGP